MLDHDDTLFARGDDRVASLFLWHFVEEVEHRSSALIIYNSVIDDPWYRMRVAPSIFKHVWSVLRIACEGFNKHIPVEERKIDALSMFGVQRPPAPRHFLCGLDQFHQQGLHRLGRSVL